MSQKTPDIHSSVHAQPAFHLCLEDGAITPYHMNDENAGVVAFLAESTDTIADCAARGDLVHQIIAATNNQN